MNSGSQLRTSWPTKISLRASSISGIKASHFALDDFMLDPPILETIRNLYSLKPPGWKDRLEQFAVILEAGWDEYKNKINKGVRYVRRHSFNIEKRQVKSLTTFARFLRDEPWLPMVDDLLISRRPSELVLNTEENLKLSTRETPVSSSTFREP